MTVTIRYGILGPAGKSGWFAKAAELDGGSEIVAESESPAELCSVPDVDAIFIPMSDTNHYEGAKAALEAGKHVLIDAPFTRHKVGANELFMLAEKKKLFLMETQKAVFMPICSRVRELVAKGEIGSVRYIESHAHLPYTDTWTRSLEQGGGALSLGGACPLTLIPYLLGTAPSDWSGLGVNRVGEADTRCTLNFRCGDVLVNSVISLDFELEDRLTIVGTDGKIVIPDCLEADTAVITTAQGTRRLTDQHVDSGAGVLQHAARCIADGLTSSPVLTREITTRSVEIISSLYSQWYGDPLN